MSDDLLPPSDWFKGDYQPETVPTLLSEVVIRPVIWVDKPFLMAATLHLLVGAKGVGKGLWLTAVASAVSRGVYGPKMGVLWVSFEDSLAMDIAPRATAAGGELGVMLGLEGGIHLPEQIQRLSDLITDEIGLVIIDPVGGTLGGGRSSNNDFDVRPLMQALNFLAVEKDVIVIASRHVTMKTSRYNEGVLSAVLGSSDWLNVARVVLAIIPDDIETSQMHLFTVSSNRVARGAAGRLLGIDTVDLDGHDEPVPRVVDLGPSYRDPNELLSSKPLRMSRSTDARTVIALVLKDGQVESSIIDAEIAREMGLSARTVMNIRQEMKREGLIQHHPGERDANGRVRKWWVSLTSAGEMFLASISTSSSPLTSSPDTRMSYHAGQGTGDLQGLSEKPLQNEQASGLDARVRHLGASGYLQDVSIQGRFDLNGENTPPSDPTDNPGGAT